MTKPVTERFSRVKSLRDRTFRFLRLSRLTKLLLRLGHGLRRQGIAFRKYKVAPRQGVREVRRRLLKRLRGSDSPFRSPLESSSEC
jgi:hypothetical protein